MPLDTYNSSTGQFTANGLPLTDTDLNAAIADVKSAPVALSRLVQSGAQIGQVLGWTGSSYGPITITASSGSTVNLGSATPLVDGFPGAGSSTNASREDHVHPTDNSRYAASNPSQFQTSSQVTTAINAALAGVTGGGTPSSTLPLADTPGGAVGTATTYARGDHSHPYDTTRAPLANPSFTGTVTLSDAGAGLVIGAANLFGTPHIYFRSEGYAANAYDASIEVTGGFVGANGQGTVNIKGAVLQFNGAQIGSASEPTPKTVTSTPYTVLPTDRYLLIKLTAPGPSTINLESNPAANRGLLWIKNHLANGSPATIASSGIPVEGASSITIGAGSAETLLYAAVEYSIV